MNEPSRTTAGSRRRGAALLVGTAMLAAALLSALDRATAPRIAENIATERLRALRAVLPPNAYDNEPHLDIALARDPELLGSEKQLPVYRARRGGRPVAAVLTSIAPNGFAGPIHLLVAVGANGELTGVRVIEHRETPGLGDRIEGGKSNWILGFRGLQITNTDGGEWQLHRDGGRFDHITGATVTSRAVLMAVRNAVVYFAAHREELFE